MTLYHKKYRVESARKPDWNYSLPGFYFITICTHNRLHLFGEIHYGIMHLNKYGMIVTEEWKKTGEKNKNIVLDEFMVMPNHIHGIIGILNRIETGSAGNGTGNGSVETLCITSLQPGTQPPPQKNKKMSQISPKSGSLSRIVELFKAAITRRVNISRNTNGSRVLQFRFHDHIIRDQNELDRIRQYIRNNPANWDNDRFGNGRTNLVNEMDCDYGSEIWMV